MNNQTACLPHNHWNVPVLANRYRPLGLGRRSRAMARRLLLGGLLTLGAAQIASAATSADPLNRPAPSVAQPQRALLNGIVRAGQRLVAVGEHGLVIWSDDNGKAWHQAAVPV